MNGLHTLAAQTYRLYAAEAQSLFPDSPVSHLCIRTATLLEYEALKEAALTIGKVTEQSFNGRPLLWVKLDSPIEELEWLEIPAPKPEKSYRFGPQALVLQGQPAGPQPSLADPDFIFRRQLKNAAQLAAN